MNAALHWCFKCLDYTYHKFNQCLRCLQVRQARTRTLIIIGACVALMIVAIAKLWWRR